MPRRLDSVRKTENGKQKFRASCKFNEECQALIEPMGILSVSMVNHMKLFVDDALFIYYGRICSFFSAASRPTLFFSSFTFQTKPVIRCNDTKCLNLHVIFIRRNYSNMLFTDQTTCGASNGWWIRRSCFTAKLTCRKRSRHNEINNTGRTLMHEVYVFLRIRTKIQLENEYEWQEDNKCNEINSKQPNMIKLNVGLVSFVITHRKQLFHKLKSTSNIPWWQDNNI